MSHLFTTPILSHNVDRRIRSIGYFGILPLEITILILHYVIQTGTFKQIYPLMHTCKFIRCLLRDHLSINIQDKLLITYIIPGYGIKTPITLDTYKILSKMIKFSPKKMYIEAQNGDSEWHLLNHFSKVHVTSSVISCKVLRTPPNVKHLKISNIIGFDWSLITNLETLTIQNIDFSMKVLDQILKNNKKLKYLKLHNVHDITQGGIDYIRSFYPKIELEYKVDYQPPPQHSYQPSPFRQRLYIGYPIGLIASEAISATQTSLFLDAFHRFDDQAIHRRFHIIGFTSGPPIDLHHSEVDMPFNLSHEILSEPSGIKSKRPLKQRFIRLNKQIMYKRKFQWNSRLMR